MRDHRLPPTATTRRMGLLFLLVLAVAGTSGGVGVRALAIRTLQAQQAQGPPPNQNCRANATAGGYDCVVDGQRVHVNASANVTQVEAPGGTIVWSNATSGEVTVSAPGVRVVCKPDPQTNEQRCRVHTTQWWPTATTTRTTTTSISSSTSTNRDSASSSLLRGSQGDKATARGEWREREEGTVRVEAGESTTDCRPLPNGGQGHNCSYNGRWAHVTADAATNTTQVTAPGTRVHTNDNTGDVEVDAWGFHLVCHRSEETGRVTCRTQNEWWPPASSSTTTTATTTDANDDDDDDVDPLSRPVSSDDEEEYVPRARRSPYPPPQPVMHLPPSNVVIPPPAPELEPLEPRRKKQVSNQAMEGGYEQTVVEGKKERVNKQVMIEEGEDKASGITPYVPEEGEGGVSPGYFPEQPQPPQQPPLVPPAVVVDPLPLSPVEEEEQEEEVVVIAKPLQPPVWGEEEAAVIVLDPLPVPYAAAETNTPSPFFVASSKDSDPGVDDTVLQQQPHQQPRAPSSSTPPRYDSEIEKKNRPRKPKTPSKPKPKQPPRQEDPLWRTNPKNCTRAAKGEGQGCWDEEHWNPKQPTSTTKPPTKPTPPTPPTLPTSSSISSNGTQPIAPIAPAVAVGAAAAADVAGPAAAVAASVVVGRQEGGELVVEKEDADGGQ